MVALPFAFAVAGSFVALSAASRLASGGHQQSRSGLITIGVALGGIGVWTLHFTGMYATESICTTENRNAIPQGTGFTSSAFRLPSMVIVPTVVTVVMLSIDVIFQNNASLSTRRR